MRNTVTPQKIVNIYATLDHRLQCYKEVPDEVPEALIAKTMQPLPLMKRPSIPPKFVLQNTLLSVSKLLKPEDFNVNKTSTHKTLHDCHERRQQQLVNN